MPIEGVVEGQHKPTDLLSSIGLTRIGRIAFEARRGNAKCADTAWVSSRRGPVVISPAHDLSREEIGERLIVNAHLVVNIDFAATRRDV
jgi:hypothetical protein